MSKKASATASYRGESGKRYNASVKIHKKNHKAPYYEAHKRAIEAAEERAKEHNDLRKEHQ